MRAIVLYPEIGRPDAGGRSAASRLEEAVGLAQAIDLKVVAARIVPLTKARPATLLGQGKVEEIAADLRDHEAGLVIVDGPLSPVQQRNLERAWNAKVLDRTGLILEIFGARARTREGALQVELAHLTYQKSRLVRTWTHLERQRGGLGFIGGPGETQIEADRRMISERIAILRRQLETVTRTRTLHRKNRQKVPYPVVALVGYTNAGKSTLFNRLTRAEVLVKDMLFATLDPTLRAVNLASGRKVILSDTVGFISDLPTHLVAAFRATLEEVLEADLLLHVRDASDPEMDAQARDVYGVLKELGIGEDDSRPMIEVFNKIDLLEDHERMAFGRPATLTAPGRWRIGVSALSGEGLEDLLGVIEEALCAGRQVVDVVIAADAGAELAWLHEHGEVLSRQSEADGRLRLRARLSPQDLGQFRKRFPADTSARIIGIAAD